MSQIDNSTTNANNATTGEILQKSTKKHKGESKTKKTDDNVIVSGSGFGEDGGDNMPATKKRRRGGNAKAIKVNVTEGTIGDGKPDKKKKRKKTEGADNTETGQQTTSNNLVTNPTQKDYL